MVSDAFEAEIMLVNETAAMDDRTGGASQTEGPRGTDTMNKANRSKERKKESMYEERRKQE
jgi:hypothetical protein